MRNDAPILEVRNLKKHFPVRGGILKKPKSLHAVDGVSFSLHKGETLGLVGESGCGKSTTGFSLVRLHDITDGEILFNGVDLARLSQKELIPLRKSIQMIFQDPYSSLNPRMTVADIISEPLVIHEQGSKPEIQKRVYELIDLVGLKPDHADRYPHEFSGGQRQRIGIARALALKPDLLICDEPISALDVSIQAQIVNLLQDLQQEMGLSYIFIAHDLSMVKYISDRICVMYLGKIVETAQAEELYENPMHPYTRALLSAVPEADPEKKKREERIILKGSVPTPVNPKPGCRFAGRCPNVMPRCHVDEPVLKTMSDGHETACHLYAD